MFVVCD